MVNYSQLNHRDFGRCCHTFCGFCAPFFQLFLKIIDGKFRRFSIKFARGHAFFAHTRRAFVRLCSLLSVIRELCHLSGQQTACGLNFFLDQPHRGNGLLQRRNRQIVFALQSLNKVFQLVIIPAERRNIAADAVVAGILARQAPDGTHRRRSDTRSDRLHRL